jgi:hypothetical protein
MEYEKFYVGTTVEFRDGKYHFQLDTTKGMLLQEIRAVLVGAINLTIRGEETPEKQAIALKSVISYMEEEFINVESFNDVYVKNK